MCKLSGGGLFTWIFYIAGEIVDGIARVTKKLLNFIYDSVQTISKTVTSCCQIIGKIWINEVNLRWIQHIFNHKGIKCLRGIVFNEIDNNDINQNQSGKSSNLRL